jgi:cell wall-associated NlpC family hydrolase
VDRNNLKAGDLIFFNTEGSISHVGIYIGNGEFIHAPRTGKPVMISSLSDGYYSQRYATARRIVK